MTVERNDGILISDIHHDRIPQFSARYWKKKVFYGQEPPSGESTATECGFNYQLVEVIYWSSTMGSS